MLKKIRRSLALFIVPLLGSLLIRLISLTNKKEFIAPESLGEEPFIMACWHGELLMIPYAYTRYRENPHVKLLISEHFDGNIIAKTLNFFGFETIPVDISKSNISMESIGERLNNVSNFSSVSSFFSIKESSFFNSSSV